MILDECLEIDHLFDQFRDQKSKTCQKSVALMIDRVNRHSRELDKNQKILAAELYSILYIYDSISF